MKEKFRIVQRSENVFAIEKLVVWTWKTEFWFFSKTHKKEEWMRVDQFGQVLFPGAQYYLPSEKEALRVLNGFSEYPKYILSDEVEKSGKSIEKKPSQGKSEVNQSRKNKKKK
ncbi:MAG: hypothetical protein ACOVNP_04345 [Flavobacterium sp.]|jgi:hypothetical protein